MLKNCLNSWLSIGFVLSATALAHADPAELKTFKYGPLDGGTVLHVQSTDNVSWNELVDGNVYFHGAIDINTKWPGFVYNKGVGIVLGSCVGAACLTRPVLWSAYAYGRDYYADPVVVTVPTATFTSADREAIIGECNRHLSADGPTKRHNFEYFMDTTVVADTGQQWTWLGALFQAEGHYDEDGVWVPDFPAPETFFPEQINHWKTAAFKINVVCDPVKKPLSNDVAIDFGDYQVNDISLFLSTYVNQNSHPNPATSCKKGEIRVRVKSNQTGLAHFKLWKKIGGDPASDQDIAVQTNPDGSGGFEGEYTEWVSVDKPTTLQAKVEEIGDVFGITTEWKDLSLPCKSTGTGGGISPDTSDYKPTGALLIGDTGGNKCPRGGQINFSVTANYSFPMNYEVTCNNGLFQPGVLNPVKNGDKWKGQGKINFINQETQTLSCALKSKKDGKVWLHAIKSKHFNCTPTIDNAGPGGIAHPQLPDPDAPKAKWEGELTVADSSGLNICPRQGQVFFEVNHNQPDPFDYRISCSNGQLFSGSKTPVSTGGVYKAFGAHNISVTKQRKIACTLQEKISNSVYATVAKNDNWFNCRYTTNGQSGSDNLAPQPNDNPAADTSTIDPSAAAAARAERKRLAEDKRRRDAAAAAEKRRKANALKKRQEAAGKAAVEKRKREAKAAAEAKRRRDAVKAKRLKTKRDADRKAAAKKKRDKALAEKRRKAAKAAVQAKRRGDALKAKRLKAKRDAARKAAALKAKRAKALAEKRRKAVKAAAAAERRRAAIKARRKKAAN